MSTFELALVAQAPPPPRGGEPPGRSAASLPAARQARFLAWLSLGWMSVDGSVLENAPRVSGEDCCA